MKRKKVSITDIARELKVTPSTVSRALNGGERIGASTRKAVLDLAEQWGYRPNPFAKSLLLNKTFNIGLIIPEFTHHFFNEVLRGIEHVTNEHGYHLIICTSDNDYEKEKKSVETLLNMRVDGLIASVGNNSNEFGHFLAVQQEDTPLVLVDRISEDMETAHVITDDFNGAYKAVDYLIQTGCRDIAYIKGPTNISTSFNRFIGYKECLKKHLIPFREELIVEINELGEIRPLLNQLLKTRKVDAVFSHNDYYAHEALKTVTEMGLNVPAEISIMGYANEPVATYVTPKLSTVKQPAFEMGKIASSFLLKMMDGEIAEGTGLTACLPTELILRETTL